MYDPETSPSRTFLLPIETVEHLADDMLIFDFEEDEIRSLLPPGLTPAEVNDVGVQISNFTEKNDPSFGAIKHGHRAERRALLSIAEIALDYDDLLTAGSVRYHFKENAHSLLDYLARWNLGRQIRKYIKLSDNH